MDIRARFSELKILNGLVKKVIICTRDSEESIYAYYIHVHMALCVSVACSPRN